MVLENTPGGDIMSVMMDEESKVQFFMKKEMTRFRKRIAAKRFPPYINIKVTHHGQQTKTRRNLHLFSQVGFR